MRTLIIFITLLLASFKIYSQEKKVNFIIEGGTTISLPKTSDLIDSYEGNSYIIKTTPNVGIYVTPSINLNVSEKIFINTGLGYTLNRFKIQNTIGYLNESGTRNIHQIQTPLSLGFKLKNNFSIVTGGTLNYIISAKVNSSSDIDNNIPIYDPAEAEFVNNYSSEDNYSILDEYNRFNFGIFTKIKKEFNLNQSKKGFISIRVHQFLNATKSRETPDIPSNIVTFNNEKEPTIINLGFGIIL